MPTTYYQRTSIDDNRLDPAFNPNDARELGVNLVPGTYLKGQLIGELTATPGLFKTYADAAVDGSGVAKMILRYACVVDADGRITLGSGPQEFPSVIEVADAFYRGVFYTQDIPGLDAAALADLGGRIIQGTLVNGIFRF